LVSPLKRRTCRRVMHEGESKTYKKIRSTRTVTRGASDGGTTGYSSKGRGSQGTQALFKYKARFKLGKKSGGGVGKSTGGKKGKVRRLSILQGVWVYGKRIGKNEEPLIGTKGATDVRNGHAGRAVNCARRNALEEKGRVRDQKGKGGGRGSLRGD